MTNPTLNLTNLAKACEILQYPIKSYQILPNPSNLTKSCQILAILPSSTKSYQSDIESYPYYSEYDESYTESDGSRQSLPNLTISHQILAILPSITKSYEPDIESYQYYIEYDEPYTESDQSRQDLPNLKISHQIVSNPSKSFQPYKILSNLSYLTQWYQVLPV